MYWVLVMTTSSTVADVSKSTDPARFQNGNFDSQIREFLHAHSGGERLLILSVVPSVLCGGFYTYAEIELHNSVRAGVFSVLLIIATVFLAGGLIYLRRKLCRSAALLMHAYPRSEATPASIGWRQLMSIWTTGACEPRSFLEAVFYRRAMILVGAIYGLCLGAAPYVIGVHSGTPQLQNTLAAFLFCANVLTGAAIYACVSVLLQSWHLAKLINVSFFVRDTDTARVYSQILARISVIGAIYIGMCQASVVFSEFSG